jgi:hypothetical protein
MWNCGNNQSSHIEGIILILYFASIVQLETGKLYTGNFNTLKWEGLFDLTFPKVVLLNTMKFVFTMKEDSDCVMCRRFP